MVKLAESGVSRGAGWALRAAGGARDRPGARPFDVRGPGRDAARAGARRYGGRAPASRWAGAGARARSGARPLGLPLDGGPPGRSVRAGGHRRFTLSESLQMCESSEEGVGIATFAQSIVCAESGFSRQSRWAKPSPWCRGRARSNPGRAPTPFLGAPFQAVPSAMVARRLGRLGGALAHAFQAQRER